MKISIFLALFSVFVLSANAAKTVEHFKTDNRQVYAYWSTCDACVCDWYYVVAYEYTAGNAPNTPPFYFYYSHSRSDGCLSQYTSEYLVDTNTNLDLQITGNSRSASLTTPNMTDSSGNVISVDLSWPSIDTDNVNNCNCLNIYTVGQETFNVKSKSNYRQARPVGYINVNGQPISAPSDAVGYIYHYGSKNVVFTHN